MAHLAIVGYYQSVEQIKRATLLVFLRGFMLLIPSFIILPKIYATEGIWLAIPMSEVLTAVVVIAMFLKPAGHHTK